MGWAEPGAADGNLWRTRQGRWSFGPPRWWRWPSVCRAWHKIVVKSTTIWPFLLFADKEGTEGAVDAFDPGTDVAGGFQAEAGEGAFGFGGDVFVFLGLQGAGG